MKSIDQYLEEQQLANMLPWMEELEKKLVEKGIDPDDFLNNAFEVKVKDDHPMKEFIDPGTAALGILGYQGLKKGYNALGGWDGIKSLAGAAGQGLKNTWQNVKGAYGAIKANDIRDKADYYNQQDGGTRFAGGVSNQRNSSDIARWADNLKITTSSLIQKDPAISKDPQIANLVNQMNSIADMLKSRVTALPMKQQVPGQAQQAPSGTPSWNYQTA